MAYDTAIICIGDDKKHIKALVYVEENGDVENLGVTLFKEWNTPKKVNELLNEHITSSQNSYYSPVDYLKVLNYPYVEYENGRKSEIDDVRSKKLTSSFYSMDYYRELKDKPFCYATRYVRYVYYWNGKEWITAESKRAKNSYNDATGAFINGEFNCFQMPLKLSVKMIPNTMGKLQGHSTRAPNKSKSNKRNLADTFSNNFRKML